MSGKESKRWGHRAKLVAGIAALLLLGVLASGAVADPSDPLGGVTDIFTGATGTDSTSDSTSTPDGTGASSASTDTSAATTTDATPTDTTSTDTTSTESTTTVAVPTAPPVSYIVTFKDNVPDSQQQADISAAGGTAGDAISVLSMYSVTFPAGEDAADAAALLSNQDVAAVDQDHSRDTAAVPDDPRYVAGDQWSLPQIGWDNVYGTVTPGGSATVAILDTGVDASHEDLSGVVLPGKNIITGSSDTSDDNGHGTAMAGIVAAATNNGTGIAGVGYAGVRVLPVKVLGADGTGTDSDVINGVVYAVQHGANVILMSFSNPGYSSALQSAITYAWNHNVVLVAATGNDGSSTVNYPAGDTGVIGVGSTGMGDLVSSTSNTGADVFLAAPGDGILSTDNAGGYSMVSGTSASAAAVAGAAALIKASSVTASSNGVIVNRLAETADAVGTASQTGNGRLNLDRAISDTSTTSIEPAGAVPNGSGGPFVGPYVAAVSAVSGSLQGQSNPACTVANSSCDPPWQTTNLTGWSELQTIPIRLFLPAGQQGNSIGNATIDIDRANGNTQGLESLQFVSKTSNVTMGPITFSSSTNGSGATTYSYSFTVDMTDSNAGEIQFTTNMLAGAHNFTGNSLQIKGGTNAVQGTISIVKPAAQPGAPNLVLTKTALTTVAPGQVMTYSLAYRNTGTDPATGVQLVDVLPSGVTYVPNSCSNPCKFDSLSNTVSWRLGTINGGSTLAKQTYKVTVNSNDGNNFQFTNNASILSAENDANVNDNYSSVATTVVVPGISGTILDDLNGNGQDDDGGVGLAGATVKLYLDTSNSGANAGVFDTGDTLVSGTTNTITTTASGDWTFGPLTLGQNRTYFVVRANPLGYTSTASFKGDDVNATSLAQTNDVIRVMFGSGTTGRSSNNEFLATQNQPDLSITKTDGVGVTSVDAGGSTTYTVRVTNNGPSSVTGAILTDPVAAGLTKSAVACSGAASNKCSSSPSINGLQSVSGVTLPTLASGDFYEITVMVNVTATSGSVTNAAAVATPSGTTDPNTANNTASDTDTVNPVADLSITKTDSPDPVNAGGTVTYTLTAHNGGPSDATGVVVTDTLPSSNAGNARSCKVTGTVDCSAEAQYSAYTSGANITLGAMAAGGSDQVVKIRVDVPSSAADGATITDSASVSANETDPSSLNNTASATTTIQRRADLSIGVSDNPDPVLVSDAVTYTITFTNGGPSDASAASLAASVSTGLQNPTYCTGSACDPSGGSAWSGSLSLGAMASGSSQVVKIRATVPSYPGGGSVSLTAVASSATTDPNSANNSVTQYTTVNRRPVTLTYTGPSAGQYSDPAKVKATLVDATTHTAISGKTVTFTLGTQTMTASTDTSGVADTAATTPVPVAYRLSQAAGDKVLDVVFPADSTYAGADLNPTNSTSVLKYTVNKEDATVTDIQPTAVALTSTNDADNNGNVDSIQLVATVQEANDGYLSSALGDAGLTLAQPITLAVSSVSKGSTWGQCNVTTLTYKQTSSDTATGSCTIYNVPVDIYEVDASIGGNYFMGGGASALDVYNPALGFATGGGWFTLDDGTKVNFGFTAKYLKSNQIQGSLLTIFHRPDGNYIVKSNSMGALAVSQVAATSTTPAYWTATLTGKSTYQIPSGTLYCGANKCGNYAFTMYAEDRGEPGAGIDTYTLQVKDPNTGTVVGAVSTWPTGGGAQNAKTITGGNIQIPHK